MTENKPLQAQRVPTGIPGLDTLLHGGFIQGGVYMVMGMPGAGKTILGNQVTAWRSAPLSRARRC